MKYFATLPKIVSTNQNFDSVVLTNLLARSSIVPGLLTDPLMYYSYDIQEGDTPEIIAHKYYGDVYRYWIVLISNQILDPQWEWPLSYSLLTKYLNDKYGSTNIYTVAHHYESTRTQTDATTGVVTKLTNIISEQSYNLLQASSHTYSLPTGSVTVDITKRMVSIYDYELELNESRRNIKLLNKSYASELERQFEKLMK